MDRKGVNCRFRKELDRDLMEATNGLPNKVLSELTRNGLRLMLGIRTTRQLEVREALINLPAQRDDDL